MVKGKPQSRKQWLRCFKSEVSFQIRQESKHICINSPKKQLAWPPNARGQFNYGWDFHSRGSPCKFTRKSNCKLEVEVENKAWFSKFPSPQIATGPVPTREAKDYLEVKEGSSRLFWVGKEPQQLQPRRAAGTQPNRKRAGVGRSSFAAESRAERMTRRCGSL